jgi:hypothetical protein
MRKGTALPAGVSSAMTSKEETTMRMLMKSVMAGALVSGLGALAGFHSPAWGAVTTPCLSGVVTTNMSPINGGTSTYCQTGFGWTDTWFPTAQPPAYDAHLDVLSGDNAPSLSYIVSGVTVGTGNIFNFLSPFLDGGHLNSQNIGGGATLMADIPTGPLANSGASTINVGQVQIGITTTVKTDNSVTELFHFTNTGTATVTGLRFDDYFNFHPSGSDNATDQFCGATIFSPTTGMVRTVGTSAGGCSPVVSSGTLQGSALPINWDVGDVGSVTCPTPGTCTTTPGVLAAIAAGTFNMSNGDPNHFGDTGADLVWALADLLPGASEDFTISKNFSQTPEPASLALLGTGLIGFAFALRRRRRV